MKGNIRYFKLMVGRVERRHIRLGLAILTLAFFVLGAGAPGEGCGAC
jgi:hypothetical protein